MKILRVKQSDGTLIDIPLGKGATGMSAYEHALTAGYLGTEEDFSQALSEVGSIAVKDESTAINYLAKLKLINGKPVIEFEEK